jgi:hypothetical protein
LSSAINTTLGTSRPWTDALAVIGDRIAYVKREDDTVFKVGDIARVLVFATTEFAVAFRTLSSKKLPAAETLSWMQKQRSVRL